MPRPKSKPKPMLRWIIPADVVWGASGSRFGRRSVRESRAAAPSSYEITLTHLPTKVEVKGKVPMGLYSRTEMKKKKEELWFELWRALDNAVARTLRIPGQ